jgi:hypothetical protein
MMVFALRPEKTKLRGEEKKKKKSRRNSSLYTRAMPSRARHAREGLGEST